MKYIAPFVMAITFIIIYAVTEQGKERSLHSLDTKLSEPSKLSIFGPGEDVQMEECQGPLLKHSFPDIDYALLGYNVLRGFPLSVGHDPGFTYPIFRANYSKGEMTADCRYNIPHGFVIIPDISCVTSFLSTTIQNKYDFNTAMSVSASVNGGGWGLSFSASAGYKETSSELFRGESISILSTAQCNYYFSKLITENPPEFNGVFLKWIYKLNTINYNATELFQFFETFGTHFPAEVKFGARYTYKYKMNSTFYRTQISNGVNVAAQASYSGLYSAGGDFNMDESQRQEASDFSKSVTTETITVGAAPPADGDAMTWASEVKTNPVPTSYKLLSIDNLFTETYMGHLNVDFNRIRGHIGDSKFKYCIFLQLQGHVETCTQGIEFKYTKLQGDYKNREADSVSECSGICMQDIDCEAISFCLNCKDKYPSWNRCGLFKGSPYAWNDGDPGLVYQSVVFPDKIRTQMRFNDTTLFSDSDYNLKKPEDSNADVDRCRQLCIVRPECAAYTHRNHNDTPNKPICSIYFFYENNLRIIKETGSDTFFISRGVYK